MEGEICSSFSHRKEERWEIITRYVTRGVSEYRDPKIQSLMFTFPLRLFSECDPKWLGFISSSAHLHNPPQHSVTGNHTSKNHLPEI